MAIKIIKKTQDIFEVFKDQNGIVNPGITGDVYDKLKDLGDYGQKRMYEQQKGEFGVVAELERIYKKIEAGGKTCAIEYDEKNNKFTIFAVDQKQYGNIQDIKTAQSLYEQQKKKGDNDFSQATFDIIDVSGENYGQNTNRSTVVRKTKKDGSTGFVQLPRMVAELRTFRKNLETRYDKNEQKKTTLKKGILEASVSFAKSKINEVYNNKANGAKSEFKKDITVKGQGKEFAIQNYGDFSKVDITAALKDLKFVYKISDYEETALWELAVMIANAKNRQEAITSAMNLPMFKNLAQEKQKFRKMANEIKEWADEYHAEDYEWALVNEGAANTGVVGVSKSAVNAAFAGNRGVARAQYLNGILHKANRDQKKEIFIPSIYRSSVAEKNAGIERGRVIKPDEYIPFDAVVKGVEVNPLDSRIVNKHTLADNVVVSSDLLEAIAGERELGVKVKANDVEKKTQKIIKQLSKNKKRKYESLLDQNGKLIRYTTSLDENSQGETFKKILKGETKFENLPKEVQQLIFEEIWRQGGRKKNRDITISDELRNNVKYKKLDNGGYIIYGTEFIRPKQGDKLAGFGANMKGSAEVGDEALEEFNKNGENYRFIIAQQKGDVRKFGATYTDSDLNALLYQYGSKEGIHNKIGFTGLQKFLNNIIASKTEDEGTIEAAKAIQEAFEFTQDGGVIYKIPIMDVLEKLEPQKQLQAFQNLLPLIDRLINGIDKNNDLLDKTSFEGKQDTERYYKKITDSNGEEILVRTLKEKPIFVNVSKQNEYRWGGANLYGGRESLKRNAGLVIAESGRSDAEKNQIKQGTEELYERVDISESKRREFEKLHQDAKYAATLTNKTTAEVKSGKIDGEEEYIVVIGKNVDPNDDYAIDISKIEEAQYNGDIITNEDKILQGVIAEKIKDLKAKNIDTSKINFVIDTGTDFGGVTSDGRTWGGKGVALPKGMTLDSEKGFEEYGIEAQRLVNLINNGVESDKIAEKAKEVMLTTQQDFQNKGSVYERFFGGKTKGVKAGKHLPMAIGWLQKAFVDQINLSNLEKWQGEMATSGAFISESMFDNAAKKMTIEELRELYKKFYNGTFFGNKDVLTLSSKELREGIKQAVIYNEDQNSIFAKLLNAGKLNEGLIALTSRFPFSNGLDIKSLRKVFIDKNLDFKGHKTNAIRLGFGYGRMFNGDFDGDVIEMLLGTKFSQNEKFALNAMAQSDEEVSKELSYLFLKDLVENAGFEIDQTTGQFKEKNGVKVLDKNILQNIFDKNMKIVAATGMRYNKTNTGKLSNLATEFRNMMTAKGFDESALLEANTPDKRGQVAKVLMGRAYLESLEQDSISSKKIIDRIVKIKSGLSDISTLSEDELYKYYNEAIGDIDEVLEKFYNGSITFTDLNNTLAKIGVLESNGDLGSGRVLQQYLMKLSRIEGGEDIIAELLGIDKSKLDFKNRDASNYFATQNLTRAQIEKIFSSISTFSGYSNSQQLFASLPKKEYTPEKKIIKEYNLATEDVEKADSVWLEHIKTLNEAKNASINEANAESHKIIIAGKEADAIRLLGMEYQNLSNILGEVSKSKDELAQELLNVDKNTYPGLGVTAQLHRQFGATYPDGRTGIGQSLADFARTGSVYINGAKYSLKNGQKDVSKEKKDRTWVDETGIEVKNKTLIGKLNRLGYSKEDFEEGTATFGALDYGTLAHRTSEILNILGIKEKDLKDAKVKSYSSLKTYIENKISNLKKSNDQNEQELGKKADNVWNQGYNNQGYGGSWNDYITKYDDSLKLLGLSDKERKAKIDKKVMIGRNYHNLVSMGGNSDYIILSENAVGIPSGSQRRVSDIDALTQNKETGDTYISDFKTKSGKIKDYELAQILKYQFGIQSLASAAAKDQSVYEQLKDLQAFNSSDLKDRYGFDDNRPMTEEMLSVIKNIVNKANLRFEKENGRTASNKEITDLIYSMVKARIIRGDEKSGESFYLSDAISVNDITDEKLKNIVQRIIKEESLTEEERAYFYKHAFNKGYGLYDSWGNSSTGTNSKKSKKSKKIDSEAQKEYNVLVTEELNLKKQLIDAEIELQRLKEVEGKTDVNQNVKDRVAEIGFLKKELDYNQTRKKELVKGGAKEDTTKTAADNERLGYYARIRGYNIKGTSVSEIEKGVKNINNLTPEEQADYWSQYERALDKQARAEEEIFGIRNKAAVVYGTERNLLLQIAATKESSLKTSQAELSNLENIVSQLGTDAQIRIENLKKQIALNKQLYKLQALKQTRGATSIWDMMANDIKQAAMRVTNFGIAMRALNKIPQSLQKIIQYTKELDLAMTNIRIVGGYTEEQVKDLMRSYSELGKTLSATTTEVATAANEWLRQGYEAESQLEVLVSASTKLSKLGMISASEATTALTAALKSFNLAAEDAIGVVDKLTKVDQLAAVSAGGIATAMQKSATSAKLAGMSMDELIGSVSVIGEVTQQSMDTVGNAMKSILSRYGNVKASVYTQMGLNDDGETSENINDIEKVLSKLRIKMRSTSLEMRDITDVLDEVSEGWETYDTVTKNALATAFGGTRMRENFLVLMENWDRVKELTEESANSAGTADEKYSAYIDSIEAATKRLQNALESFTQSLESSSLIKFLTNVSTFLVENFDKLKYLINALVALNSTKIVNFFTSEGISGGLKGLTSAVGSFFGSTTKTNNLLQSIDNKVGKIQNNTNPGNNTPKTKKEGYWHGIKRKSSVDNIKEEDLLSDITIEDENLAKEFAKNDNKNWGTIGVDEQNLYYKKVLAQKNKKTRINSTRNAAITAGISTALTQLATDKTIEKDGVSVEENALDKGIRTGLSTGLSMGGAALGTYFLGPIGGAIGSAVGSSLGEFGSYWISRLIHNQELQIKKRVEEANTLLKTISSVETAIDNNSEIMKKQNLEDSEREELEAYKDQIRDYFIENPGQIQDFLKKFSTNGEAKTLTDILNDASVDNQANRQELQKNFESFIAGNKTTATYASQEEDRYDIDELYKIPIEGVTLEEKLKTVEENLKKIDEIKTGTSDKSSYNGIKEEILKKYQTELNKAILNQNKLNKEWLEAAVDEAYIEATKDGKTLSEMSQIELTKLGLEGAIKMIAKQLEKQEGISIINNKGQINEDAYNKIIAAIKEDENVYSGLQRGDLTIAQYLADEKTYADRIKQFALAFNITEKEAKKLGETFGDLTTELGNMTPENVIEYYENLASVLSSVVAEGGLTASALNQIATSYPRLLKYALQGTDKLLEEYYKIMMGGEMDLVTKNALNNQIFSNSNVYEYFKQLYDSKLSDAAKEATSLLDLKERFNNEEYSTTEADKEAYEEFINKYSVEYQKDLTVQNQLREYEISLMEDEIDNLNDQKDALSDINEQRKKELEYLKAKYALEDARKEKKRVFRAGVGWSYEVDEEAISEAKENLDELQIEKDQDAIQYQIDFITAQKEFLESLPDEAQNERLKTLMESMTGDGEDSLLSRVKILADAYADATTKLTLKEPTVDNDKEELTVDTPTAPASNKINGSVEGLRSVNDWRFVSSGKKSNKVLSNQSNRVYGYVNNNTSTDLFWLTFNGKKYEAGSLNKGIPDNSLLTALNNLVAEGETPKKGDVYFYQSDENEVHKGLYVYNNKNDWRKITILDDLSSDDALVTNGYYSLTTSNATGTTSFKGGQTFINELGTEAVITPGGTLTALPSKSGIVPADITKNVWALGEVAPTLVAKLSSLSQKALTGNAGSTTYEEGQYFDNFTMNVYPAKGDDFSKILEQARAQARLTKRNN